MLDMHCDPDVRRAPALRRSSLRAWFALAGGIAAGYATLGVLYYAFVM